MFRSALLTATLTLGLGMLAPAQVVNYGGWATTAPTVNPTGAPSVPALNTPVAHVGPTEAAPTQPGQTAPEVAPFTTAAQTTTSQPAVVQIQNPTPVSIEVAPATTSTTPVIDLGAADLPTNPFVSGSSGTSGKSLGEIAREMKQKDQTTNARMYTNADIERMGTSSGANGGATTANATNNEWPANNGVITPPENNPQNSIAAPAQNQSTTGNGPFSSKAPANTQPENPPQANAKPSPDHTYEMAQNNPQSAGIPQAGSEPNAGSAAANDNTAAGKNGTLPKTASRLPLIGVLGFFSISMGLFVRYQREKSAK